jgi:hypothetical protein
MEAADRRYVRVEMTEDTIARLLAGGQLCAAEVRCADGRAKRRLWRLVLESCRPPEKKNFGQGRSTGC